MWASEHCGLSQHFFSSPSECFVFWLNAMRDKLDCLKQSTVCSSLLLISLPLLQCCFRPSILNVHIIIILEISDLVGSTTSDYRG